MQRLVDVPARSPRCYDDGRFEFLGLPPGEYEVHNRIEWMSSPVSIKSTVVSMGPSEVVVGMALNDMYKELFFDAPGYESGKVDLTGQSLVGVIVVRLKKPSN